MPGGWESARARELESGTGEWRLLLQLASDETLGFQFGDGGNLYFMTREQDVRDGRFENVWIVVQAF